MQAAHGSIPNVTLNDGTAIPQLGFGTLHVQPDREVTRANIDRTAEIVGLALQAGYRHIDTAQSYGTERGVGEAIASLVSLGRSCTSRASSPTATTDRTTCDIPSLSPSRTLASNG